MVACGRGLLPLLVALLVGLTAVPATAQDEAPNNYWYEIEALNPGLGAAPEDLARSTPQQALDSFIDAARDRDWDRAAHLLDLTSLDPAEQGSRGPDLARRLAKVIERKLWIDWGSLSDRPDALVEVGTSDDPMAGQVRKSQRLGILEAQARPYVLRLDRVKPKAGDAVWLISSRTVANIPALFAAHGPGWFERAIPESWTARVGDYELRRWELVALPVFLAATLACFALLRMIFGWLAQQAPWGVARNAASAARMPVAILVTALLARLAMETTVTFSSPVTSILVPVLLGLMIIGAAVAVLRAIDAMLDKVTERYIGDIDDEISRSDRQLYTSIYAIRRIVVLIAFVAGAGLLLQQLHLTQTLGISLLASAGVLTVILGIAGQSILGNIMSSLQLAIAKPIRIGDAIDYEGTWAYVEAIFYTFVRLRTWDDRRMIVPVKHFVSQPFYSYSMVDEKMTRTFDIWLDHRADPDVLREAWEEMVEDDGDALEEENNQMLTMGHDHNGQMFRFYCTAKDASTSWDLHARLREEVLKWIRANQPDWWPRERVVEATGTAGRGGAVGDAGG